MRIVIIGTGNTAAVLGKLLLNAGHQVSKVLGRNLEHAEQLANKLKSSYGILNDQVNDKSDLYIIAVADDAIAEVIQGVRVDNKLIIHTAGSVEKDILSPCSKNYGVLYPLQTLRKEMTHLPEIPFLVDGNTADNAALIGDLAKSISPYVEFADDTRRLMSHTAAVIVSNFTNHLYALAEDFCIKEKLDFKMFMPLIREVTERVRSNSPGSVQTGPAVRNDTSTIDKHISLLSHYPLQRSVYRFLTDSIRQWHGVANGQW